MEKLSVCCFEGEWDFMLTTKKSSIEKVCNFYFKHLYPYHKRLLLIIIKKTELTL